MGQKRAASPTSVAAKRAKVSKTPKKEAKRTRDSYPPAKASSQPREENGEGETEKLLKYLEKADKDGKDPFRIKYPGPKTKKSKPHTGPTQSLRIGENELSMTVEYFIDPQTKWSRLSKYRKFTVGGETYAVGDVVLVKHGGDDSSNGHIDLKKQWKALVLEVRALDENHVYLRVTWLENPEDLPGGRKHYHGKYELVPSNDMSIVDAMTVNGGIKVRHWDDADDTSKVPAEDEFFWRQEYEKDLAVAGGAGDGKLSALHKICVCEDPHNPDEKIIQCAECDMWLHTTCIAENAVKRAKEGADQDSWISKPQDAANEVLAEEQNGVDSKKSKKTKAKTKGKGKERQSNGVSNDDTAANAFSAVVDVPEPEATSGKPTIVVQDVIGGRYREEEVKCLHCTKIII